MRVIALERGEGTPHLFLMGNKHLGTGGGNRGKANSNQ